MQCVPRNDCLGSECTGDWENSPDPHIPGTSLRCLKRGVRVGAKDAVMRGLGVSKPDTRPTRHDVDGGWGHKMQPAGGSSGVRTAARGRVDDVRRNVPRETLPCPCPCPLPLPIAIAQFRQHRSFASTFRPGLHQLDGGTGAIGMDPNPRADASRHLSEPPGPYLKFHVKQRKRLGYRTQSTSEGCFTWNISP